ncbi:MAG: AAA family ATPase [Phaeodactylibacter sp.]|nr:AAA family ATPase [Phaeodactylibacter sp.]
MTKQALSIIDKYTTDNLSNDYAGNAIQLEDLAKPVISPFKGMSARQWLEQAATKPMPKQLFDQFWFEGELSVLFSSTNTGKSVLAVQIATDIASGIQRDPWRVTCGARTVLFFDFELSDRQFARRYSEQINDRYDNLYKFPKRLIRYERQPAAPPKGMDMVDYYIESITQEVKRHDAKIIVIDNITWINAKLQRGDEAGEFLQKLNNLKASEGLSILLIAHTPKRDATSPITINDLAGSARVMDFLDSAFAIGSSTQDPQLRYIKQIKVRECEKTYSDENVMVCMLEKPLNFLQYRFVDYANERDHLKQLSDSARSEQHADVHELRREGYSIRAIADTLNLSKSKVDRLLKDYKEEKEDDTPF